LSIAGGISLLFSVPAGHLSDRYGPRNIGAIAFIFEGLFLSCLVFVHSYTPFLLINIACGITGTIGQTMRMATISKLGTGDERVAIRAYQRTVTNLGIALGSVVAGVALAINTQVIYQGMLLANALTFILSALVFLKLPYIAPTVEKSEPLTFEALKDRRFLGATVLNGFMSLHFVLQTVAIPLWIVNETNAPRWWVSVIFVINTVGVILFQIRASRGSGDVSVGARQFRRAGFAVSIACLLYALASGVSTLLACLILVAAMCVHVFGEVVGSAGSWSIGFGLADERHQGQYQGVYSLSWGVGGTIGPAFVTAMAITIGQLGWVYMAALFSVTGVLMYRLVTKRWLVLSN
jgi:MFS family permease